MNRYDYVSAINSRVKDLNNLLDRPLDTKAVGHIDWRREGIRAYSLFRIANEHGGTRGIRNAASHAELLDYVEGLLDGIKLWNAKNESNGKEYLNA